MDFEFHLYVAFNNPDICKAYGYMMMANLLDISKFLNKRSGGRINIFEMTMKFHGENNWDSIFVEKQLEKLEPAKVFVCGSPIFN
jgi:hypothetical protein